ncbi:hypothetical protein BDV19DRAFT_392825 [Aspergillus venezuelensis]
MAYTADEESDHLLGNVSAAPKRSLLSRTRPSTQTCLILLMCSVNILALLIVLQDHKVKADCDNRSTYANLATNVRDTLHWNTEYSSSNETAVDSLWRDSIPWESGIIALTKQEAQRMSLPKSQPFPWDPQEKSIYIINAHHILHCVVRNQILNYTQGLRHVSIIRTNLDNGSLQRNLYISIHEYRHNTPQSITYPHILHCLDSIRLETICTADDTPRYIPPNAVHGFRPGDGQTRQCRDWTQLDAFVRQHDPCYRYICPGNGTVSNLERFKYCSANSEYLPRIREYFGLGGDWKGEGEERDSCTEALVGR